MKVLFSAMTTLSYLDLCYRVLTEHIDDGIFQAKWVLNVGADVELTQLPRCH